MITKKEFGGAIFLIAFTYLLIFFLLSPSREVRAQGSGTQVSGCAAVATRVTDCWPVFTGGTDGTNARAFGVASAANLVSAINSFSQLIEKGPRWQVVSNPAVSTQASASKAAGGAGVRHVADCISFSGGTTSAAALTSLNVNLRDGASGAGTVLWTHEVVVTAATGENIAPFAVCGLNLEGSANTAMTFEFSALLTNLFEAVNISGYDVQ